jgi:hypothetical protein
MRCKLHVTGSIRYAAYRNLSKDAQARRCVVFDVSGPANLLCSACCIAHGTAWLIQAGPLSQNAAAPEHHHDDEPQYRSVGMCATL